MEVGRKTKLFGPIISSTPGVIEVVEGQQVHISVKVKGNPAPTVRWQIGRKKVKSCSKYRVDQEGQGHCSLVIMKGSKTLEEGVWVVATNDHGEDCCMIEVKVRNEENSSDGNSSSRMFKRFGANARSQPSLDAVNKIETENAPKKPGVIFGLGAKKKTLSLSKSFELDEVTKNKKSKRIDRSMVGEFNFFKDFEATSHPDQPPENPPKTPHSPRKFLEASSRPMHKPPPLPARSKMDDANGKRRKNRWKKETFNSHGFVATSSEVELNEEEEEEDEEEPVEAVRITKKKMKKKQVLPVSQSLESSRSSMNSVCLETNFDDCDPKQTEGKLSWQPETEFSSSFASNSHEADDKLEAEVIAQVNKSPAQQGDGDAWQMNGVKIERLCHDLLSNLEEIHSIDCHRINNTHLDNEMKESSFSDHDSDFQMETYCESPKRRNLSPRESLIKISNRSSALSNTKKTSPTPQAPLVRAESSAELHVEGEAQTSDDGETSPEEEDISVEHSPSASSEEDDEEDEMERVETEKEPEVCEDDVRPEVTTDEEAAEESCGDDSGGDSGGSDGSDDPSALKSEHEVGDENENPESPVDQETSAEKRPNITNTYHVTDVNSGTNDDNNNSNNVENLSPVKSVPLQFIDSEEEDWPAPPSSEILNSLRSPPLIYNNKTPTGPSPTHDRNGSSRDEHLSASTADVDDDNDVNQSGDHTSLPMIHASFQHREPSNVSTYREAIMERAGGFGLIHSMAGLKSYSAGASYRRVEFNPSRGHGKEMEARDNGKINSAPSSSEMENSTNSGVTFNDIKTKPADISAMTHCDDSGVHSEQKVEEQMERRSAEKKSVRFLESDAKPSDGNRRFNSVHSKLHLQSEIRALRPPAGRPEHKMLDQISSCAPKQIHREKESKRFAYDECDGKKVETSREEVLTSPVTVHEYAELISFSPSFQAETKTMEELTMEAINEVVTNRCTVREAVKNILKSRHGVDRPTQNLWSNDHNRVILPPNISRKLGDYPLFVEGSTKQHQLGTRYLSTRPGMNNTQLPEPHFV